MKKSNNNFLSIGSESQYSATSELQSGGGIMNLLFGSGSGDYATQLILDAFKNQYPQIAYFIINHGLNNSIKIDFSKCDNNKQTILHHIVSYSKIPIMKDLLSVILLNTDAKNYINMQDNDGNTVVHIAAKDGLDMVIDELVKYGANLSIANNSGKMIHMKEDNDVQIVNNIPDIFIKITDQKSPQISNDLNDRLDKLLQPLLAKTDSDISFRRTDALRDISDHPFVNNLYKSNIISDNLSSVNTDDVLNQIISGNQQNKPNMFSDDLTSVNSDDILNQIMSGNQQKKSNNTASIDSDDILNQILMEQTGGSHKTIKGKRTAITYSEDTLSNLSGGSDDNIDDDGEFDDADFSELSSIARAVENQATEAHKRSVKRIMEILHIDEIEARAYKSLLYDIVKKELPNSNYDRAVELEKRAANKDILEKISKKDVKDRIKLIDEKYKMKESSQSNSSSEPIKRKNKRIVLSDSESGLDTISSIDIE